MTGRLAKILVVAMVGLFPSFFAHAEGSGTEVGTLFSPKEIGLSIYFTNGTVKGNGHLFRIMTDMHGVIRGETGTPGLRLSYNRIFCIRYWEGNRGTRLSMFAGPGVSGGYVRDSDKDFGTMACLCGLMGWNFCYRNNVSITFGFSGEIGCHFTSNSTHDTTVKIYKNGLKELLIPEISIGYRF